nr:MAG TPA: hypothetical protein [Caudoviricetes sp.]
MATLTQRVGSGGSRVHDDGGHSRGTLEGNQTVGILSDKQHGIHVSRSTSGRQNFLTVGTFLSTTGVLPRFHQSGEQITHALDSTDFVFHSRHGTVVLHILKMGHVTNVGFAVGMTHSHKAGSHVFGVERRSGTNDAVDVTSLLVLQLTYDATLEVQSNGSVHSVTLSAISVFHVRTAQQHTHTHTFNHFSSLLAHNSGSIFQHTRVVGVQQHVGQRHQRTILVQSSTDVGGGQGLRIRRDTFRQLRRSSIQSFVATELSDLRALLRQGVSLTKLLEHQIGQRTSEELENRMSIKHSRQVAISGLTIVNHGTLRGINSTSHCNCFLFVNDVKFLVL